MTEAWELGIEEASRLIREGQLSAADLLDSVLSRLQDTEEYARAWAYVDEPAARAAAMTADTKARTGALSGPLHGIPVGIKDVIDVQGMPTEGGSISLRGNIADRDAGAVRQLRGHGAVILGKLETHEFAFGQGTPPPRNPWGHDRYAGGSSVGSGVAVAVGSALGALGTDTGGSVRNPAAVNGLVGLKPTTGLVDTSGVLNVSHSLDHIGPIARSVEDCAILFEGMLDPMALSRLGGSTLLPGEELPTPVRLAVDRGIWGEWGVSAAVVKCVEGALTVLQDLGMEIVDVPLPELDMALPASLAISLSEAIGHHRERLRRDPARYLSGTRIMIETGALISPADVRLAWDVRKYLQDKVAETMRRAEVHALVSPTLPAIAPLASAMSSELTGATGEDSLAAALRMLSPANLLGMPGLSVPCGFAGGHPVGLHLMGHEFADAQILAIALAYERAVPWRGHVPVRLLPEIAD
ncbi:amidase [Arthrobacter sp. CDRTa11]|uniref:amidase n=1 Tax=Arthrobacter sp. CDRTa11 TaxID=2651199 RepID=UPI002265D63C|nr:amidase [Arthrobacter sp. CDRTa11]UZX03183.1 amidase [Arthrobacter sp. CDRTa11]